jgi:hypothetical protein
LSIKFVDPVSLKLKAQFRDGECIFETEGFLRNNNLEAVNRAAAIGSSELTNEKGEQRMTRLNNEYEKKFTIGVWGTG